MLYTDAANDLPQRLMLGGYVAISQAGFALPCYGASRLPNQWYVATCSPSGDPEGRVSGFEPSELSGVTIIPDAQMRDVGIGDPWIDVFLWDGLAHVGSRMSLWSALEPVHEDIMEHAPLSGLDLAFGSSMKARRRMARAATTYLTNAYGASHARDWRRQVARTRFLSRLRQIGLPTHLTHFDVTGVGAGGALSLDAPNWSALPDAERDLVLRAAKATAEELGLKIRPPRSLRPPLPTPPFIFEPGRDLGRPTPDLPRTQSGYEAAVLSILIITSGSRAAKIGRAAKTPEWNPEWSEVGSLKVDRIVRDREPQHSWLPWVEIRSHQERPIAGGYGVVVILADDDVLADKARRTRIVDEANALASREATVILAPALPEDGPASALKASSESQNMGVDIVLDTSLARSPLWGSSERLSLDRRIADLIITTAQACLPGSSIPQRIYARRGEPGVARLASLAIWNPEEHSDAYGGEASFLSESNVPAAAGAWLDEYIPLRGSGRQAPAARLMVGALQPDFDEYVGAVLRQYDARELLAHGELWSMPFAPPSSLRLALSRPDVAAGFRVPGPEADYCALVAETPTLEVLQKARAHGWIVARITDGLGLDRIIRGDRSRKPIPTEVALPPLRRFRANRKLATRGVDSRDVVRIPGASGLHRAIYDDPILGPYARAYLPSPGREEALELAIPVEALEGGGRGHDLAEHLLTRFRTRGVTARRLADLSVLWSVPGFRRYAIEDGHLPPRIVEIDGANTVPAQTYFAVDGDEGVPCLFGSCLFDVWARLTRSRGSGWTPRFAVSRTFETFPIIPPFETVASTTGGAALLVHDKGELGRVSRLIGGLVKQDVGGSLQDVAFQRARATADNVLLRLYGLSSAASELDIAQRLVDLNQSRGDVPSLRVGMDQIEDF